MGDIADGIIDGIVGGNYGVYLPERRKPSCSYCGRKGLVWREVAGKWRLFQARGVVHTCDAYTKAKSIPTTGATP